MAPLALSCPLCCNETFSSHSSLKYHLLSMIDNLLCPACNARFDDILTLSDHLGRECKENETELPISTNLIKTEAPNSDSELSNPESGATHKKIKEEQDAENRSVLAKALKSCSTKKPVKPTEELEDTEENPQEIEHLLYTCQMCNISFNSIEEHLQQYHDGEEVVLENEVDPIGAETTNADEELLDEEDNDSIFITSEDQPEDEEVYEESPIRSSKNTVEEQQCFDKDGRVYTRKVVKIDKFWEEKQDKGPMTEKYLLENGKIKKITDEEAEIVEDKNQIIEIHQCPQCYLQFPNMNHYNNHKCDPSKVKTKTKFKCTHCSSVYLNMSSLTAHMRSHMLRVETGSGIKKTFVTIGPQICDICNTAFPSFKSLRLHKRMHDPVKDKEVEAPVHYNIMGPKEATAKMEAREMFICEICQKTYDKEYEEVHMKSHDTAENFNCTVCNRKFFTKDNLEMHMKAHSNGKKFSCSYCKKPFTNYTALEDHVRNQCQKRQYECQYCGRRFARPHEKVKHERIHTGEKPHVCQICGKAFRVSYCLTLHLRTHSGTRPYECQHCSKRFKSHSVYNHHLLTHSDVRNYKCPYCPKAFKTSVQLAGHKNSHTKPFACTECNRPFASLYAVRAHMETHKRENNLKYDCWLCGATYARSFALKDHMKSQHADYSIKDSEVEGNVLIEFEEGTSSNVHEIEHVDTIETQMEEMHREDMQEGNEMVVEDAMEEEYVMEDGEFEEQVEENEQHYEEQEETEA